MFPGGKLYGDNVESDVLKAAIEYVKIGWSVVPLAQGTKHPPAGETWKNRQFLSAADCPDEKWKKDHPNVSWGRASGDQKVP